MAEVINSIKEFLSYGFIQRALLAGFFVAASCSLIGLFLVLRRLSLIGDGLAHIGFASVAIALVTRSSPLFVSLPLTVLASIKIHDMAERSVNGDAAIGIISSLGVAVGVLIASIGGGFNVDLLGYLFGSILAIGVPELVLSAIISVIVAMMIIFFYADLFSISYDEEFAKASGMSTKLIGRILAGLTAAVVSIGIRVVGTLLVSALIVLPASGALQLGKGFKTTLLLSLVFASVSVFTGIIIACLLDLPPGAMIVILNFIVFGFCYIIGRKKS